MLINHQLNNLSNDFDQLNRILTQKEGESLFVSKQKEQIESKLKQDKEKVILIDKTIAFVQKFTELSRKETLDKMSFIVTTALQDIKDSNLSFKINYDKKRNMPVADFLIHSDLLNKDMGIMESCGGTLFDIVEFSLRVSLLLKWKPSLSRIFILDESFKHVSPQDRPKLAKFVRDLSEKLDLQIILISHSQEVTEDAHKIFAVSYDGIKSTVRVENV